MRVRFLPGGPAYMSCVFCTLPEIQERTIVRTEHAFAFLGNMPIVPGHTLVCPKRCVATLEELTAEEREGLFELVAQVKQALQATFDAEGFNVAYNEGLAAGQTVPHLHIHVVPRKSGDTGVYAYEPRQFLYRPGERETSPQKELQIVAEKIQKAM
jgi:diadenosine tetraphosphate (Ap4A) HIT family hydrolase